MKAKQRDPREIAKEFTKLVEDRSRYGGDKVSYDYVAGFCLGMIESLAHIPGVRSELETQIRHLKKSLQATA